MTRLRNLAFACLVLLGCDRQRVAALEVSLVAEPTHVELRGWRGFPLQGVVALTNASRVPLEVSLTGDGLQLPAKVELAPQQREAVAFDVSTQVLGLTETSLTIDWHDSSLVVPVHVTVEEAPTCAASPCTSSHFDPQRGACVSLPNEGASCSDDCVTAGVCRGGVCSGHSARCDDGNACTTDACGVGAGCEHQPVVCAPPEDPCHVAVCDAKTGCGVAPVIDGVSCGGNDCTTAHVCISGVCVARRSPDGSECGGASVCQGVGHCEHNQCVPGLTTSLPVAWAYHAPIDATDVAPPVVHFSGHVDAQGNTYFFELRSPYTASIATECDCVGCGCDAPMTQLHLVSLAADGGVRFRQTVKMPCDECRAGLRMVVNDEREQVAYLLDNELVVRSSRTGALVWRATPSQGLPVLDRRPDGGAAFSVTDLVVVTRAEPVYAKRGTARPTSDYAVVVSEGYESHYTTTVFYGSSGVAQGQHRAKGHSYGVGAWPNGDLISAIGDCWAPVHEVVRVNDGVLSALTSLSFIPSAHARGLSVGVFGGAAGLLDDARRGVDGGVWPLGPMGVVPRLIDEGRAITVGSGVLSSQVSSVAVSDGRVLWSSPSVPSGASLEALNDGGLGWQSEHELGVLEASGQLALRCPLPSTTTSPIALWRGLAFVETADGVAALRVSGFTESSTGWTTADGALNRGRRAR